MPWLFLWTDGRPTGRKKYLVLFLNLDYLPKNAEKRLEKKYLVLFPGRRG